jgi:hypothetical protein
MNRIRILSDFPTNSGAGPAYRVQISIEEHLPRSSFAIVIRFHRASASTSPQVEDVIESELPELPRRRRTVRAMNKQ